MNPNEQKMTPPGGTPTMPQSPAPMTPKESHTSMGAIIGIIVIIAVLIIGGLYIWGKTLVQNGEPAAPTTETTTAATTEALKSQSSSTKASAIEADLNATNLNNLDAELNNIGAELNK